MPPRRNQTARVPHDETFECVVKTKKYIDGVLFYKCGWDDLWIEAKYVDPAGEDVPLDDGTEEAEHIEDVIARYGPRIGKRGGKIWGCPWCPYEATPGRKEDADRHAYGKMKRDGTWAPKPCPEYKRWSENEERAGREPAEARSRPLRLVGSITVRKVATADVPSTSS